MSCMELVATIEKECCIKESSFWLLSHGVSHVLKTSQHSRQVTHSLVNHWQAFFGCYCFLTSGLHHLFIPISWSWVHLVLRPLGNMINSLILQLYITKQNLHVPGRTLNDFVTSTAFMCEVNKYLPTHHASIVLDQAFSCMVLLTLPCIWLQVSEIPSESSWISKLL